MASRGRQGAHRLHAKHGNDTAGAARAAFLASFEAGHECRLCPAVTISSDFPEEERLARAAHLHKAHMQAIARLSRARRRA
jgi:hypothetical protein